MKSMRLILCVLGLGLVFAGRMSMAAEEHGTGKAGESEEKEMGIPQPIPNPAKAVRPSAPELIGPAFMEKISGSNVTLKWNPGIGAVRYHVQVAKDPNFKWLLVDEPRYQGTSYEVKALESQKHYYWRVFSRNEDQEPGYTTSQSAKSMFQTQ